MHCHHNMVSGFYTPVPIIVELNKSCCWCEVAFTKQWKFTSKQSLLQLHSGCLLISEYPETLNIPDSSIGNMQHSMYGSTSKERRSKHLIVSRTSSYKNACTKWSTTKQVPNWEIPLKNTSFIHSPACWPCTSDQLVGNHKASKAQDIVIWGTQSEPRSMHVKLR